MFICHFLFNSLCFSFNNVYKSSAHLLLFLLKVTLSGGLLGCVHADSSGKGMGSQLSSSGIWSHFLMSKLKNFHQILDSFVIDFFIALDIEPFFSYHQQLLLHEQLHPFHVVLLSHHLPVLGCSMRSTIFVFIQQG